MQRFGLFVSARVLSAVYVHCWLALFLLQFKETGRARARQAGSREGIGEEGGDGDGEAEIERGKVTEAEIERGKVTEGESSLQPDDVT